MKHIILMALATVGFICVLSTIALTTWFLIIGKYEDNETKAPEIDDATGDTIPDGSSNDEHTGGVQELPGSQRALPSVLEQHGAFRSAVSETQSTAPYPALRRVFPGTEN